MTKINATAINDIQKIYNQARAAYDSGITKDVHFRKIQLKSMSQFIKENYDELIECLAKDLSKPRFESTIIELQSLKIDLKLALNNLDKWVQPQSLTKSFFTIFDQPMTQFFPLGTVLIIGPWNYPLMLNLQPMIGAIAAGNSVILKPSEYSTHCSNFLAETLPKYLNKSCYHVINGGPEISQQILKFKFDHIFFTGSSSVGKIVYEAASKYLTPVTLELGGKSPLYLDPQTQNLEKAVERILWGKFVNSGQTCVAPDYILTTHEIEEKFSKLVNKLFNKFFPNGLITSPDYGRLINQKHFDRLLNLLKSTKGTVLAGGKYDAKTLFLEPTIIGNVETDDSLMSEEIFGPLLPIVRISNEDEAIQLINKRPKPLALYVFSENMKTVKKFINNTSSGALVANDTIVYAMAENLHFGGIGESGIGAYHGKATFETFSHKKCILIRSFLKISEIFETAKNPPYNDYKANLLCKLLEPTGSILPSDIWLTLKHFLTHISLSLHEISRKIFGY